MVSEIKSILPIFNYKNLKMITKKLEHAVKFRVSIQIIQLIKIFTIYYS